MYASTLETEADRSICIPGIAPFYVEESDSKMSAVVRCGFTRYWGYLMASLHSGVCCSVALLKQ